MGEKILLNDYQKKLINKLLSNTYPATVVIYPGGHYGLEAKETTDSNRWSVISDAIKHRGVAHCFFTNGFKYGSYDEEGKFNFPVTRFTWNEIQQIYKLLNIQSISSKDEE